MNPRVYSVEYKGNYKFLLTFKNKEVRQFDLSAYLKYPVYAALKDEAFCKTVKVVDGILKWNDSIDFSPDTVYLESEPVK
jgi:hypothetical protein